MAGRGVWRRVLVGSVLGVLGLFGACSDSWGATLTRGFVDDVWFDAPHDHITPQRWIAKTEATGAKLVQIEVDWTGVEPHAPKRGANGSNPAARQFNFAELDARVEEFARSGLQPVFLVTDAPRWAEAHGGSAADYAMGGYKPSPTAFRDLGEALAKRYSGTYPNPVNPRRKLPRVRYMQAWAEANTDFHLAPQWTRIHGRVVNTGAIIYRGLLNSFYSGVKAGDPRDVVIASGLEGYGDPAFQGLQRTRPVRFLENVLCLSNQLKRVRCAGGAVHFDVLASDPYDSAPGGPTVPAVSPLDASAPDLRRLTRVVAAARVAHTVIPNTRKPLWVTEFGYDSNPPNHAAVSTTTQARWLEQALYVFWHEGVTTVLWYLVRDQPPPYSVNYASGVYFRDGRPKPAYTAYRFPLVVMPQGKHTQIWGIAPATGAINVQRRENGSWTTFRVFHRSTGQIFSTELAQLPKGAYRATLGTQKSLAWTYNASSGADPQIVATQSSRRGDAGECS